MKQKRYLKVRYILLGFFAVLLLLSGVFMRLGGFSTGEAANVEAFQEYAQPVEKLTIPEGKKIIALGEATHGNREFQQLKLDVFKKIYEITTRQASDGTTPLEVGYSIGLPVGILLFFNHFTSWKFSLDPTPLEVEMRLYEENVNKTLIQNEERKEDDIDVS